MGFRVRLRFPGCRTLKDRRMQVEGLIQGSKKRHGFSAADISDLLKNDYAEIGFAAVGASLDEIRGRLDRVLAAAENGGETQLIGVEEYSLQEQD